MPTETKLDTGALMQLVIGAIMSLTKLAVQLGEIARQDAELTPEASDKLDADIAALKDSPHWKVQ